MKDHHFSLAAGIIFAVLGLFAHYAHAADLGMKDSPRAAVATAAEANPVSWSGVYVGGQVGYGNSNHDIGAQDFQGVCRDTSGNKLHGGPATACTGAGQVFSEEAVPGETAFIDGLNSHGALAGLRLGADLQRGNWVFGAFGDYNFSQAEMTTGFGPSGAFRGSIEDGDSWLAAARVGYLFGEDRRALLYVLGGYGQQDVSYHGSFGSDTPFNKDVTFSGFVAGAGAEYALTKTIFLGLEYQHFFGSSETIFDNRGEVNCDAIAIEDRMQSDKVMGRISFKFGPGALGQ